MNQITAPLFKHSGIDLFYYVRYYNPNESIILTTYSCWNYMMLQANALTPYEKLEKILGNKNCRKNYLHHVCYYLLEENNLTAHQLAMRHRITSIIGLIDQQKAFIECFYFASRQMKNLIPYYFTHWDNLIIFKHYFLDTAKGILAKAEKTKIFLPTLQTIPSPSTPNKANHNTDQDPVFPLTPRHYYLLKEGVRITITSREFHCLQCIAHGQTLKETGKRLGISARTVEDYCNRLKHKLGLHTKSQLINLYLSTELSSLSNFNNLPVKNAGLESAHQ